MTSWLLTLSQGSHCFNDLLHRWQTRSLGVEIVGVVSNHETLRVLTEWHGLPFTLMPADKTAQEAAMLDRFEALDADYLILARFMQILSPALVDRLAGRCINIHHSFLPSFKGARRVFLNGVRTIVFR